MSYKYAQSKCWNVPKQKYKLANWSEYNLALKNRGRIDFWLALFLTPLNWKKVDKISIEI
ncbi:hypothetical protein [Francisella sp. TX07-6608]|uniref:hypothetical protein n=1 Tax=Francisella sp. TX07-6608 TaxID=573568 RepID=UPI0008F9B25A|nr:putative transposase domain protein [Francisella sp. TX07-6608]